MKRDGVEHNGHSEKVKKTLRGRAEKACVRCRAKKRTCDGGNPCLRCKESHSACYFSDWHYTVPYPREYVEYLEEQQEQLSTGLMTLYSILKESNIQTVPALPDKPEAQDLLAALKGVKFDSRAASTSSSLAPESVHMQVHEMPSMLSRPEYRHGSTAGQLEHPATSSLSAAAMYTTQFEPGLSPNVTSHSAHPTPAQYAPPYRSFDAAPAPLPPHLLITPHAQRYPHVFSPGGDGPSMHMSDSWHSSPAALTPNSNPPLDLHSHQPTPLSSTPSVYAESPHEQRYLQQYQQPAVAPPLGPSWPWEPSMYGEHVAYPQQQQQHQPHDGHGLSAETLEQQQQQRSGEMSRRPHKFQAPGPHA